MEELRSTEILDKEIIADAEKKAERIERKADEECSVIIGAVSNHVSEEIQKAEENFALKLKHFERDLNASIPLEKSRFYVSFIQNSVIKNINSYFDTISEDKILSLLTSECKKVDFSDVQLKAYVYGLNEKNAEEKLRNILGNKLKSVEKTEFNKIVFEDSILENNKGIILLSDNGDIKCRFTLCRIIEGIMNKYRAELAQSLLESEV